MVFFIVLLAVTFLILAAALWAFRLAFYNPIPRRENPYELPGGSQYQRNREKMLALVREFDNIPFEPVSIVSHDGLKLYGRYYHVRSGAPLQIQFHGYRGTALRDFCGGNKIAREAGINTLVVDQRAHGESQGRIISMGINERLDCLAWTRYAAERFGPETKITLAGVSMGAATVLMASELDLPENVKGIIADCPYSSPTAIIAKVSTRMKLIIPPAWGIILAKFSARLYGGFDLSAAGAVDAVKSAKVPILLIHGMEDHYVPCEMSREIAAAGEDIRLELFPNAGHGLSFIEDEARYRRIVREFLEYCDT